MKTLTHKRSLTTAAMSALTMAGVSYAAPVSWTGASGTTNNWSDGANWSSTPATPGSADALTFDDTDKAADNLTVNNIVDTDFTIQSLKYVNMGTTTADWHVTQISNGATLQITNAASSGDAFSVGPATAANTTQVKFTGGGALNVSAANMIFSVSNLAGSSSPSYSILDMSGLASLSTNVNEFQVGGGDDRRSYATLNLAVSSAITANTLNVGSRNADTAVSTMSLGQTTQINANDVRVSWDTDFKNKSTASVLFTNPSGSTVTIGGKTTSLANLSIAQGGDSGTGASGTVDFRGGTVNASLNNFELGSSRGTAGGASSGTFSMSAGTVTAVNTLLGQTQQNGTWTGQGIGVLNVAGGSFTTGSLTLAKNLSSGATNTAVRTANGTLNVSGSAVAAVTGNVLMGDIAADSSSVGNATLNLTGGKLQVAGNIAEGASGNGSVNSKIILNGGTLEMLGGSITVDALDLGADGGTLMATSGAALTTSGITTVNQAQPANRSGTRTAGNATITGLSDTSDLQIGMGVTGTTTQIPVGTTIVSKTDTSITLSNAPAASGSTTLLFYADRTLTLAGASAANNTFTHVLADPAAVTGNSATLKTLSLVKNGAGKWILSNANTYTGPTSVNAGTLQVDGSIVSATSVASAGTLAGGGSIKPAGTGGVSIAGELAPGSSIGTLTVDLGDTSGGFTLSSGATIEQELGDSFASDVTRFFNVLSGDVVLNSNAVNLSFIGSGSLAAGTYTLMQFYADAGTTLTDTGKPLSGLTLGSLPSGYESYDYAIDYSEVGKINLVVAVPEPASLSMLAIGGLALLRRRRA